MCEVILVVVVVVGWVVGDVCVVVVLDIVVVELSKSGVILVLVGVGAWLIVA